MVDVVGARVCESWFFVTLEDFLVACDPKLDVYSDRVWPREGCVVNCDVVIFFVWISRRVRGDVVTACIYLPVPNIHAFGRPYCV